MIWIIYALSTVLLFTTLNLVSKVLIKDSKDPRAFGLIFNLICAFFALLIFIFSKGYSKLPENYSLYAFLILFISSAGYGLFERFRFYAIKHTEVSVNLVISSLATPLAFFAAIKMYNEPLSIYKLAGALLVFCSVILTASKAKGTSTKKGIIASFFVTAMLGMAWVLDKAGSTLFTPEFFNILVWTLPLPFIFLPYVKVKNLKYEWRLNNFKIFIIAFLNVGGYYLNLKALQLADASKVMPIIQTSLVFSVIAAIFLFKENKNLGKKIIAAILSFIGICLLSINW